MMDVVESIHMQHADCHVHCSAEPPSDAGGILRAMDKDRCEFMVIISPDPRRDCFRSAAEPPGGALSPVPQPERRAALDAAARLVKQAPGRLFAFAFLDPALPGILDELDMAKDLGFAGVKMIPRGWYPWEQRFRPVFARIEKLGMPMLFHTGILWSYGDTSRFCRPAHLEFLMEFPGIRFLMAHGAWPWIDECVAVALKFKCRHEGLGLPGEPQATIDTTRGTPPIYRRMLLERAAAVAGVERMVYGSDQGTDTLGRDAGWREDVRLARDELGWTGPMIKAYLRDNLACFLGLKKR